jgi:sensor histidine kinase YesM
MAVNLLVVGGIYFLLGGGLALRGYFGEQRLVADSRREAELAALRLEGQQSAMRLSLLQAQIAPHFLFNTLASIRALLRQDAERAEATLDALVDHLRACMPRLDDDSAHHATVGEQFEICRSYLELMRLRTGGRLDYAVRCPAELADEPFLPLLLLTLVENAVKHGVEAHPGPVTVTVEARREADGQLCLRVEDSGAGLQPGLGKGVGLANVRAQLASRYGEAAKLRVHPREGGGVRAEIRLPASGPA